MAFCRRTLALLLALLLIIAWPALAEGPEDYDIHNPQNLSPEHLFAQSALLVDEDSGETLFSKNSGVRMYPASTTKIMTLLLALESDIALDARVTIPAEAADIPEGSSVIPVKPGDVVSFSDLLYGFMLSSGNDGANAIAVLVDGSIEAFVARMNARAAELGCEGTHYVNAHGYHTSEHYTTARDLAVIAREAMKNETFRKIVAAPKWTMTVDRGGESVSVEIVSRNSLLQSDMKYYYPDCTGIKTGHHSKAGWCFVGSAERDGKRVICVVLNCAGEMDKWYDAARLFEYGFTRYAPATQQSLLQRAFKGFDRVQIENADPSDPEGGSLPLNLGEVENGNGVVQLVSGSEASLNAAVEWVAQNARVEWTRQLIAPVSAGEVMGHVRYNARDGVAVSAPLIAARDIAAYVAPTEAPAATLAPAPGTDGAPRTPNDSEQKRGNGAKVAIIALVALLAAVSVTAAVAAGNARRRRARRRRRRSRR